MKKSILLIALIIYCVSSCAQNFQWAKTSGGPLMPYTTTTTDIYSNVYTSGTFQGTVDFDPGPGTYNLSSSSKKMYLLKLNSSGNFVWVKEYGGGGTFSTQTIVIDTFGNIILIGDMSGTFDFDPDTGTTTITSNGNQDICIAKFNASGKFKWARSFGRVMP